MGLCVKLFFHGFMMALVVVPYLKAEKPRSLSWGTDYFASVQTAPQGSSTSCLIFCAIRCTAVERSYAGLLLNLGMHKLPVNKSSFSVDFLHVVVTLPCCPHCRHTNPFIS